MIRQAGFVLYAALGALLVISLLGIALKVQTARLDASKAKYEAFVTQVKAAGEIAQAKADREKANRKAITASQEKENAKKYNDLSDKYAAARRLLNSRAGSGETKPLSAAASIIACPDRQADAAGRLERLEAGILNIIERGDKAILRTIDCKAWLDGQMAIQ